MTNMELLNEINRLNARVADLENTVKVLVDAFSRSNDSQYKINDKTILDTLELSKDNEKENGHDENR